MTQTAVQPYQEQAAFNPNEHIMQIKNKNGSADYLPVQWRLVWFREHCPQGTIDTEELVVDLDRECEAEVYAWNQDTRRSEKTLKRAPGYARFRATVTDGKGGRATATKTERGVDFGDYVEKAETGAVGRALAMLGYGTQFVADELDERERIVDAPVEKRQPSEQEREKYQQRKPFVEGTVAATPGTEHLTNGNGSPAFPAKDTVAITRGELFERGEQKGMWTRMAPSAFYAMASAITGRSQSKQDWTMTADEMGEMARQIEAARATKGNEQPAA